MRNAIFSLGLMLLIFVLGVTSYVLWQVGPHAKQLVTDDTLLLPFCNFTAVGICRQTQVWALHLNDERRERIASRRDERKNATSRLVEAQQLWKAQRAESNGHLLFVSTEKTLRGGMWQSSQRVKMIRDRQTHQSTGENTLCYAFLRDNEIWTSCQGKRERLRVPFRISEFAVSTDGSHLAYYTLGQKKTGIRERLALVSLEPEIKSTTREIGNTAHLLSSTCGTILEFQTVMEKTPTGLDWPRWKGTASDLIGGKPVEYPPNDLFQCSADRKIVAGWTDSSKPTTSDSILKISAGNKELRKMSEILAFQVSPNGKFVYYAQNSQQQNRGSLMLLCVAELLGQSSCFADLVGTVPGMGTHSVSDSGEVLYLVELENESCGGPACTGIAYWRPGMSKGEIVESEDSSDPQWITPGVAARLHEWASTVTSPIRQGRRMR